MLYYFFFNGRRFQQLPEEQACKGSRIDEKWQNISQLTDPADDSPIFVLMPKVAKIICLLPHSNAFSEGIFSTIRKIVTHNRANLGQNVKEGHAASSVYADHSGTRNTLCGLLAAKVNIFKATSLSQWTPSAQLLSQCKQATYLTLKSRPSTSEERKSTSTSQ
jgi:hypothetical protein